MTNNESPRKLKPQLRPGQYALTGGVPEVGPSQPTDFARDLRQPTRAPEVTVRPPLGPGPAPAAAAPPPQPQAAPKPAPRPGQFSVPGGIPEAGPADFTHADAAARKANLGRSNFVSPGYADHFAPESPAATATKQVGKFGQGARLMGKLGGTAVGAGMEGHSIYKVAKDPKATGIDVTTQAFEGVSKLAGTTAGGLAGTAMAGPVGGLIGGAVGYFAPELATKGLRKVFSLDTSSPIDRTNAREQALRTQVRPTPAPGTAQGKRGPFTESFEKKMEALPRTQFLRAGSPEANAASAKMDSGEYLPGSGQGMVRSGNGNVTMLNTGAPPPPPSADYLRRQYAPTVYNDEGASWKHSPSQAPKEHQGNTLIDQVIRLKQAKNERLRGTQERGQDMTYAATLRGQDISSMDSRYGHDVNAETSRYGHNLTANNARARMGYDINKDLRDFAISSRAAADTHFKSTQEAAANVYKNKFFKPGKDGVDVPDERAEKRAYDISNQLSKGAFGLRAREDQSLLQQDTQELTNMFMQMETPRKTGGDYFLDKIGMAENAQTLSAMPNFKGGTIKLLGANWNAGTGKNDYELTDADGRTHYMSNMSERQRELLLEMGIKPFDPRVDN